METDLRALAARMASCVHAYGPADPRTAAAAQALSEARVMLAIDSATCPS